ncbi:2-amino-4-hydroxy-6-hydroxymethyldihydropteridine diphosphokinase [Arcanobacterium hippocoleae]|uniref:2-amino-4-hydroxy-6- hydroxymethyldihydropteridine diphosphokinase n=1 Tax=Arcanobacterium hippocoleae TaxID=149017 RepID=UPI003340DDA7
MHEVTLRLTGVSALGKHGVLDFEKQQSQPFVTDVEYVVVLPDPQDLRDPGQINASRTADELSDTISYADVADLVVARIKGGHAQLIETLAADIATAVITKGARKASVTVHKPAAPIKHEFADVSATVSFESEIIREKKRRYVIALGSNLEDPVKHLQDAFLEIYSHCADVIGASAIYRSAPILAPGQAPQPDYYNAVMEVEYDFGALRLLHTLQEIEAAHGRDRNEKWGARTLDLDLIASDFTAVDPELILPHPRAKMRRFVLAPWHEINPNAMIADESVARLLPLLAQQEIERTEDFLVPGGIENLAHWIEEYYLGAKSDAQIDDAQQNSGEMSEYV